MTDSTQGLKTIVLFGIIILLALALLLWSQVPDLFLYFNQAFCAH